MKKKKKKKTKRTNERTPTKAGSSPRVVFFFAFLAFCEEEGDDDAALKRREFSKDRDETTLMTTTTTSKKEEEEEKKRFFAVLYTDETRKKRPKWKDGFVKTTTKKKKKKTSMESKMTATLYGNEPAEDTGDDVSREGFAKNQKLCEELARVGKEEKVCSIVKKLTEEEETTIEEFNGYKVQVDEEFSQSGMTTKRVQPKEVSLFRATRSARPPATTVQRNSASPKSFRNPMFNKKTTTTTTTNVNTFTRTRSLENNAKFDVGKRARMEEEESDVYQDVGTATKENEPCNAAKQQKKVNVAATLKERLAVLTKRKQEKTKMMETEIAAASMEEEIVVEEIHTEEEDMIPTRVVNYGNTNVSHAQLQQQRNQQQRQRDSQYRYTEPSISIKFPFERICTRVALQFEGGVREYRNYLISTSCEQLSLKLRNVSDAIRTAVQTLPQHKKNAPFATNAVQASTVVDPKNLGVRLGRQYRIHYWSDCKMTAYRTQSKKDEETGTIKPSKTIVEFRLGRCEHLKTNDFAKGDIYVLSTDPGFFLSAAKNARRGVDTYQNWTGVVASTWHAPDKDGIMHVEVLGELPRILKESLKSHSDSGWVKRKSITLYAARALSAFGELEEMKNVLEMVKDDTMPLLPLVMNPSSVETNANSEHLENLADAEEDFQNLEFEFQNQYGLNHDQAVAMKGMVNTERGVSLVH